MRQQQVRLERLEILNLPFVLRWYFRQCKAVCTSIHRTCTMLAVQSPHAQGPPPHLPIAQLSTPQQHPDPPSLHGRSKYGASRLGISSEIGTSETVSPMLSPFVRPPFAVPFAVPPTGAAGSRVLSLPGSHTQPGLEAHRCGAVAVVLYGEVRSK